MELPVGGVKEFDLIAGYGKIRLLKPRSIAAGGELPVVLCSGLPGHTMIEDIALTSEIESRNSPEISFSSRINADLLLQLAEIRKAHEELQNVYDGLRSFISDQAAARPKMSFCATPDQDGSSTDEGARIIVQILPVEMRRLCGVSINIAAPPPEYADGWLEAEVFSPDDDIISFRWSVPYTTITTGWLTLALEQEGSFLRRAASLRICFSTTAGRPPSLSLGRTLLRSDKAAVTDGHQGIRPLALRIWTSMPGAPLMITGQMMPSFRVERQRITYLELTFDLDLEFSNVRHADHKLAFEPIVLNEERGQMLVHPTRDGPTVARLRRAVPAGTRDIFAEVETVNERAGEIEYAIAVVPFSSSFTVDELNRLSNDVEWTTLPALSSSTIALSCESQSRPSDLLLLTRLPIGGVPDYCWSYFKRVYFRGLFS